MVGSTSLSAEQAEARGKFIGSSEVSCLFGVGRKSAFELWFEKTGRLQAEELDEEYIEAGIFLEKAIAKWAAHRNGWTVQKVRRHIAHKTVDGWGASLDYEIVGHEHGPAPLEVKNVAWFMATPGKGGAFNWLVDSEAMEAPPAVELQLQHQIGARGTTWGAIAANIGGNKLRCIARDRDATIQQQIADKIGWFWGLVKADTAPEPDLGRDLDTLRRLFPEASPGKVVDMTGDADVRQFVRDIKIGRQYATAGTDLAEAAMTALLWRIRDAEAVLLGDCFGDGKQWQVVAKTQKRKGYIVQDGFSRPVRIAEVKEEKEKK